MSKVQTLRAFVNQRLTAAAEDIFKQFERTIAEYEEELCRHRKLLNAVFNPEVRLHRADVQQLLVNKEAVPPEQQQWSPSLDQEDSLELPHIKVEQEELWSSQEGEQLRGLKEADIITFKFAPVPVKSEEDEERPESSQLHQSQTQEDCGGAEPARNCNPDSHFEPGIQDKTLHFSEPKTYDSICDWKQIRDPESGLNPLQNFEEPVSDMECKTGKTSVSSSECATSLKHKGHLQKQKRNEVQTGVKSFSCSVCGKRYYCENSLTTHMRLHSEGKRFSCQVCTKTYQWKRDVVRHMRIHTGEKPFSCSVCSIRFARKEHLRRHSTVHTGEKPFSCSVCGKGFARRSHLRRHSTVHTGEKAFSCSVCKKRFTQLAYIKKHKCVGESSRSK